MSTLCREEPLCGRNLRYTAALKEEFWNRFIRFVEENGWSFGGGISEIRDGWYILPDGSRGSHVLDGE